jgi:hypothetical protein
MMAKKFKNEVTSVPEASGNTICLPKLYGKVAEFDYEKNECRNFDPGHESEDHWLETIRDYILY